MKTMNIVTRIIGLTAPTYLLFTAVCLAQGTRRVEDGRSVPGTAKRSEMAGSNAKPHSVAQFQPWF